MSGRDHHHYAAGARRPDDCRPQQEPGRGCGGSHVHRLGCARWHLGGVSMLVIDDDDHHHDAPDDDHDDHDEW